MLIERSPENTADSASDAPAATTWVEDESTAAAAAGTWLSSYAPPSTVVMMGRTDVAQEFHSGS